MTDLDQLIRAEARELHRHRAAGGSDDYLDQRERQFVRLYGSGSKDAIYKYMHELQEGTAE